MCSWSVRRPCVRRSDDSSPRTKATQEPLWGSYTRGVAPMGLHHPSTNEANVLRTSLLSEGQPREAMRRQRRLIVLGGFAASSRDVRICVRHQGPMTGRGRWGPNCRTGYSSFGPSFCERLFVLAPHRRDLRWYLRWSEGPHDVCESRRLHFRGMDWGLGYTRLLARQIKGPTLIVPNILVDLHFDLQIKGPTILVLDLQIKTRTFAVLQNKGLTSVVRAIYWRSYLLRCILRTEQTYYRVFVGT